MKRYSVEECTSSNITDMRYSPQTNDVKDNSIQETDNNESISATALLNPSREEASQTISNACSLRAGKNEKVVKFPLKLMYLLDSNEYKDVISWTSDGKAFIVKDRTQLVETVLPLHFKVLKYNSFVRKLYRWGFYKILRGDNCGAFFNKHFQRTMYEDCKRFMKSTAPPRYDYSNSTEPTSFDHGHNITTRDNSLIEAARPPQTLSNNCIPIASKRMKYQTSRLHDDVLRSSSLAQRPSPVHSLPRELNPAIHNQSLSLLQRPSPADPLSRELRTVMHNRLMLQESLKIRAIEKTRQQNRIMEEALKMHVMEKNRRNILNELRRMEYNDAMMHDMNSLSGFGTDFMFP